VYIIHRPVTVTINLAIILLNALIWLILAIMIAVNAVPGLGDQISMRWALGFLSIAIAIILLALTYFCYQHSLKAYYLTLVFFIFTSVLVIFDDVGLADIIVLMISITPIVLLIKDRKWYLQLKPKIDQIQ